MSISGLLLASIRLDFAARLRGVYLRSAPVRRGVSSQAGETLAVECITGIPAGTAYAVQYEY